MNALAYRLLDEPKGPIEKVIRGMVTMDVEKRLSDMERELRETPDWLARKGLPMEGPRQKSAVEKTAERLIIGLSQEKVDALVTGGVHSKIAEARVLADATQAHEISEEALTRAQKRLDDLRIAYPRARKEFERLTLRIPEIVDELINKMLLDHLMQSQRFHARIRKEGA